ncbi:MAG: 2-oxoacid:acceptor oxidoreductase family protein [Sphaerochaetaceae bacterium]|nr:2-oxoacid:acceptor oxidoreductase family protein [Sphaerochaetaceae bacterium]
MNTIETSSVLYTHYERKEGNQQTTHYCPGCGHGVIQKMIASAIEELGVQNRAIFLSPVGCSVFSYYYYDTGNIQCSHGRAPAVGTGVKRVLPDSVVVCYQGDGDLAGIGMTEIIHAANRGEQLTVFFINNATYGMTGGQMAPTTLLHEKTLTTPFGRESERDGKPLAMAEVIASLDAPAYVRRCAVSSTKELLRTREAVRIGLKNQVDKLGFSFIEILSPCPTNWKMSAVESRNHIEQVMKQFYPLKTFVDKRPENVCIKNNSFPLMNDDELLSLLTGDLTARSFESPVIDSPKTITIAGFGGQGILSGGTLLANSAMAHGLDVSWLPSYGPEMRGGKASVTVIVSDSSIPSPLDEKPDFLLAMNGPSLQYYKDKVKTGGTIIVNSTLVDDEIGRDDVNVYGIPATAMAQEALIPSAASVVMVTSLAVLSEVVSVFSLKESLNASLKRRELLDANMDLMKTAENYITSNFLVNNYNKKV